MVEYYIRDHSGEFRRKELWQNLPKKMMYQTFCVILDYLSESGKIAIDWEGKVGWIWRPERAGNDNMKTEINEIKKKAVPVLKRNGVVKAGIFGSYAKGKAKKTSDVDILIKFKGDKSLLDLVGLKIELEDKLGKKVDILTYSSIHPLLIALQGNNLDIISL